MLMQMHVCVCLCLVLVFSQCTYFQNMSPPGSLQAAKTLLDIRPVSFIMLLLPSAFFPPMQRVLFELLLLLLQGITFTIASKFI